MSKHQTDQIPLEAFPNTDQHSTKFECGLCDFDIFHHTSMKFYHDPRQEGRFENCTTGMTDDKIPPDDGFFMYWCEEDANVVLARNILEAAGYRVYTLMTSARARDGIAFNSSCEIFVPVYSITI